MGGLIGCVFSAGFPPYFHVTFVFLGVLRFCVRVWVYFVCFRAKDNAFKTTKNPTLFGASYMELVWGLFCSINSKLLSRLTVVFVIPRECHMNPPSPPSRPVYRLFQRQNHEIIHSLLYSRHTSNQRTTGWRRTPYARSTPARSTSAWSTASVPT